MVLKKIFPSFFGVNAMLNKVNARYYEKLSQPNIIVLDLLRKLKQEHEPISVVEIGVGIGATSLQICQLLEVTDKFYCLDYEDKVQKLVNELKKKTEKGPHIIGIGNSRKR